MAENNDQLVEVVTRVSKPEIEAQKAVNQLIKSGVETLIYDKKNLEITATMEHKGIMQTQVLRFSSVCNQMELTQIDTNDKESRDINIVKMYREGNSQADIARMHGLSQTRVHNILKEAGAL